MSNPVTVSSLTPTVARRLWLLLLSVVLLPGRVFHGVLQNHVKIRV